MGPIATVGFAFLMLLTFVLYEVCLIMNGLVKSEKLSSFLGVVSWMLLAACAIEFFVAFRTIVLNNQFATDALIIATIVAIFIILVSLWLVTSQRIHPPGRTMRKR